MYIFSILLIVLSNIVYNICQKSTPERVNPFLALLITYLTGALLAVITLIFQKSDCSLMEQVTHLNWTSFVLGFAIVGLEFGYLMAYRAGWNISVGSLVANIALAVVLIPVGIFVYKEGFEPNKLVGAVICVIGLIIINR